MGTSVLWMGLSIEGLDLVGLLRCITHALKEHVGWGGTWLPGKGWTHAVGNRPPQIFQKAQHFNGGVAHENYTAASGCVALQCISALGLYSSLEAGWNRFPQAKAAALVQGRGDFLAFGAMCVSSDSTRAELSRVR
jgi:hypothetical protein